MDDGKAASGSVRLFSNGSTGCYDEETLEYMADGSDPECTASIMSDAMN